MNDWSNEPMIQWDNEPMNEWVSETMNQWVRDSVYQWINDSVNHWISDSMFQWINESWTNEWAAVAMRYEFNNLQPPAAIPQSRRIAASLALSCAQPYQCVLSQPVANPHCRITPSWPSFAQRRQCEPNHTNLGLLRTPKFSTMFLWNRAIAHFSNLIFQKCSERYSFFYRFEVQIKLSYNLGETAETQTQKIGDPRSLEPSRPRICSPVGSQLYLMMGLTQWCDWHDGMLTANQLIITYHNHRP